MAEKALTDADPSQRPTHVNQGSPLYVSPAPAHSAADSSELMFLGFV